MDNPYELNDRVNVRRKTKVKAPSPLRHFIGASALIITLIFGFFLAYNTFWTETDAVPGGNVNIATPPLPERFDNLNANSETLPDLLGDDIATDVNPTQALITPPIELQAAPRPAGDDSARLIGNAEAPISRPRASGPTTIFIDGKPINAGQSQALPKAPIEGISQTSPYGRIPSVAADGRRALTSYARPGQLSPGQKGIAIIIGGLGLDPEQTERAIRQLPPDVTLSFAAHAPELQNWIDQARAYGHEVMLEVPMQSDNNVSSSSLVRVLKTDIATGENIRALDWIMSRAQGYFALTNYNGDVFLSRSDAFMPTLLRMRDAGLGFIFDGSSQAPALAVSAESINLPFIAASHIIDESTQNDNILAALARLESAAQINQITLGVGFSYPQTLSLVDIWLRDLNTKGLTLVPASQALGQ